MFKEKEVVRQNKVGNTEVRPDTTGMVASIDADTLVYAVCSVCEAGDDEAGYTLDMKYALPEAMERVEALITITGCDSCELHFTGGNNFRFSLTDTYKANRGDTRVPAGLKELKAELLKHYPGKIHTEVEADDVVVWQRKSDPSKYLICSPDKDVYNGCEGVHFNYYSRAQSKNKWGTILKAIPMRWVKTTKTEALVWTAMQAVMGDSTDGIEGVPKCGPVGALKVLVPATVPETARLKKLFKAEHKKEAKLWEDIVVKHNLLEPLEGVITEASLWKDTVTAFTNAGLTKKEAILSMRLVSMHQMNSEGGLELWTEPLD